MSEGSVKAVEAAPLGQAHLRYFDFVMAAFVTVLLLSNGNRLHAVPGAGLKRNRGSPPPFSRYGHTASKDA